MKFAETKYQPLTIIEAQNISKKELQVLFDILFGFSPNGTEIHWIQQIQGIWNNTEAWNGVNIKILSAICAFRMLR